MHDYWVKYVHEDRVITHYEATETSLEGDPQFEIRRIYTLDTPIALLRVQWKINRALLRIVYWWASTKNHNTVGVWKDYHKNT